MPKIDESCSCGADISVDYFDLNRVTLIINEWRKEHRHEKQVFVPSVATGSGGTAMPDGWLYPTVTY